MKILLITLVWLNIVGCSSQPQHCGWEECPANETYEEYSDAWCIKEIHMNNPQLSYEQCEFILFHDCKDTLLNN